MDNIILFCYRLLSKEGRNTLLFFLLNKTITNNLKPWEKYHKEQYCYNYFMEMVRNKKPNKTNFKYL